MIIYVAKTGSDATGDGTQAKPFLTIQKAVDKTYEYIGMGPYGRFLISVGAGTYTQNLRVFPAISNRIVITGVGAANVEPVAIIEGAPGAAAAVETYGGIILTRVKIKTAPGNQNGVNVTSDSGPVVVFSCVIESSAQGQGFGIFASNVAMVRIGDEYANGAVINGFDSAVYARAQAFVHALNLGGSGNNIAYRSSRASVIIRGGTTTTATTLESKDLGGQILS